MGFCHKHTNIISCLQALENITNLPLPRAQMAHSRHIEGIKQYLLLAVPIFYFAIFYFPIRHWLISRRTRPRCSSALRPWRRQLCSRASLRSRHQVSYFQLQLFKAWRILTARRDVVLGSVKISQTTELPLAAITYSHAYLAARSHAMGPLMTTCIASHRIDV